MTRAAFGITGRPRDPRMTDRIRRAACEVYGRVGWAGFTIDAVAKEAHVGKSSIYLRWPAQTTLLLDALQSRIDLPFDTDLGSLRTDLLALSRSIVDLLESDVGDALLRLSAEARAVPALAPRWTEFISAQASAMRAIARRGVARGDLPDDSMVAIMLDAILGGLLMRHVAAPLARAGATPSTDAGYVERLVDMVLASARRA